VVFENDGKVYPDERRQATKGTSSWVMTDDSDSLCCVMVDD
jgi:hypothetical protein